MKYTHHSVIHELADGTKILWNRIQGKSVEDYASKCLRPLTAREARESDQIDEEKARLDAADALDDLGKEAGR